MTALPADSAVADLDVRPGTYQVRQHLIRNKYAVYDDQDELVLRGKQKLFKLKEQFPFVDADDEPVFTVKAANLLDIAGDYELIDERTGEPFAVLSKNFTFFLHSWTIRTPDGDVVAEVRSQSKYLEALRTLVEFAGLIPHKYDITAPDGRQIGSIEGHFSIRDRYDIEFEDPDGVASATLLAAVVAIDALEGN